MAASTSTALCPPILTADAMREADRYTIEDYGLPSLTLMESAGRGSAEHIQRAYGPLEGEAVVVLCGKGNNGGDGLVVARRLLTSGARVHVVLTSVPDELSDDAAHNLTLLRQLAEEGTVQLTVDRLGDLDTLTETVTPLSPRLYVDALLGTGLTSEVREPTRSLVEWLNERDAPAVSIDVPTGLHSDTGTVLGVAVHADQTVTMAAPKVGMLVGEGPVHTGNIDVVDIGMPPFVLDRVVDMPGCAHQTTDAAVQSWWPGRAHDAHKYSVGAALVVGGAPQYTGAPAMASKAAARSGAGYVSCACPDSVQPSLAEALPTIPTLPLPDDEDGLAPGAALDALSDALDTADALLVGPGLGRAPQTERLVRHLVQETDLPLVLDADGLNALAGHMDELSDSADGPRILTPHAGEFRRLVGEDVDLTDRVRVAQTYADQWGAVCLLKGAPSIVAGPDGRTFMAGITTPALATAGTGDVLAGQCVGLLAQGVPPLEAAAAALHLGGAAAERYGATRDPRTMAATDLLDMLPRVAAERFGSR